MLPTRRLLNQRNTQAPPPFDPFASYLEEDRRTAPGEYNRRIERGKVTQKGTIDPYVTERTPDGGLIVTKYSLVERGYGKTQEFEPFITEQTVYDAQGRRTYFLDQAKRREGNNEEVYVKREKKYDPQKGTVKTTQRSRAETTRENSCASRRRTARR